MSPVEAKVYKTRARARKEDPNAKYNDIFSSVVKRIKDSVEFLDIKKRFIQESPNPPRSRAISICVDTPSADTSRNYEESSGSSGSDDSQGVHSPPRAKRKRTESLAITITRRKKANSVPPKRSSKKKIVANSFKVVHVKPLVPRANGKFACALCPDRFERHAQMHCHIMREHPTAGCPACDKDAHNLRHKHECFKCGEFATSLQDHLRGHYAQSTRPDSLLECGSCAATFCTLTEVVEHERRLHGLGKKGRKTGRAGTMHGFTCRICGDRFGSRYLRDQHFLNHFQSVIESVWQQVERMQEADPTQILVNQCPMCSFVMGSRKSFRTHIVHRHLVHDSECLDRFVGPEVKREDLAPLREHIVEKRAADEEEAIIKEEPVEEEDSTSSHTRSNEDEIVIEEEIEQEEGDGKDSVHSEEEL